MEKKVNVTETKVDAVAVKKELVKNVLAKDVSKSKKMIEMYMLGLDIKEIAELMGTRYNFVYNVISNMVRMTDGVELRTARREDSKKEEIIDMLKAGKTKTEIATALKCNYNYVFKIEKDIKVAKAKTKAKKAETVTA